MGDPELDMDREELTLAVADMEELWHWEDCREADRLTVLHTELVKLREEVALPDTGAEGEEDREEVRLSEPDTLAVPQAEEEPDWLTEAEKVGLLLPDTVALRHLELLAELDLLAPELMEEEKVAELL